MSDQFGSIPLSSCFGSSLENSDSTCYLSLLPGNPGEVTLPCSRDKASSRAVSTVQRSLTWACAAAYVWRNNSPVLGYLCNIKKYSACFCEDMFCCFLKLSKQSSCTGDETRTEVCIMWRILGANYNVNMKGNCNVLVFLFLLFWRVSSQSCGPVRWFWKQSAAGDGGRPLPHR